MMVGAILFATAALFSDERTFLVLDNDGKDGTQSRRLGVEGGDEVRS